MDIINDFLPRFPALFFYKVNELTNASSLKKTIEEELALN